MYCDTKAALRRRLLWHSKALGMNAGTFEKTQREQGARLGVLRLGRRLGRGGSAEVFEALHRGAAGFERPVCVKRLVDRGISDRRFHDIFYREARFAGLLHHTNIVQIFDCIEEDDQVGLVMELVDGMDLMTLIQRSNQYRIPLSQAVIIHVAGQLLSALSYAHERGVIHRDISPHNVLISRWGEVKLSDFGIATALATLTDDSNSISGKLAYMSPEQARGQTVDARTDLYSAGLVLYELVTGVRYFPPTAQWSLLRLVANAERPSLADVDEALAPLLRGLLEPDREARIASAEDAFALLPDVPSLGPIGALALSDLVIRLERNATASSLAKTTLPPTADLEAIADARSTPPPANLPDTVELSSFTHEPIVRRAWNFWLALIGAAVISLILGAIFAFTLVVNFAESSRDGDKGETVPTRSRDVDLVLPTGIEQPDDVD